MGVLMDQRDKANVILGVLILILVLIVCWWPEVYGNTDVPRSAAYQYVDSYFGCCASCKKCKFLEREALTRWMPQVIAATHQINESRKIKIPPLLAVVTATKESGWRPMAEGKSHGETGILQVHGAARKRCLDRSIGGLIYCGVDWLGLALDACGGDLEKGVTKYMTGNCKPIINAARKRVRIYKRWSKLND